MVSDLYGFKDEKYLSDHLQNFEYIGCWLWARFQAAWFASLSPNSKVIGIDFSSASYEAHKKYKDTYPNLIFAKGDIANTLLPSV